MAFTGFDSGLVRASLGAVNNSFEGAIRAIHDDMQSQFVGGMAGVWACREAQEFFQKKFKPQVDSIIDEINNTFERITDIMNDGGRQWARKTGDMSVFTPFGFTRRMAKISVDAIRENMNGERGIDVSAAQNILQRLDTIKSRAMNELIGAKRAVNNSGFLGGSQQTELNGAIDKARKSIENTTESIMLGIKNMIKGTADTYGDTAGKISSIFSGIVAGVGTAIDTVTDFVNDFDPKTARTGPMGAMPDSDNDGLPDFLEPRIHIRDENGIHVADANFNPTRPVSGS